MRPDYTNYWIRITTELVFVPQIDGQPVKGSEFIVVDADNEHVWLEERFDTPLAFVESAPVTLCFKHKGVSTQEILVRARSLVKTFAEIDAEIRGAGAMEWVSDTLDDATRIKVANRITKVWCARQGVEVVKLYNEAYEALHDLEGVDKLAELYAFERAVMRKFTQRGCVSVTRRGITRVMTDD